MPDQAKNVFIVGIKGAAMANLAVILKKMGKNVSGSDIEEEFITDELLKKNKISWHIGFNPSNIPANTELIVYSAAHQGDKNPQVIEAKKRKIKILHQAELLGQLIKQFKTSIAVCGCHGKTTTASLLSYSLIKLGAKPSYMIGSSNFNEYPGGDFNGQNYFVIEADEYGVNPPADLTPKFHFLSPNYILCTNIDFDHPDIYSDLESTKSVFSRFFQKVNHLESIGPRWLQHILFMCADDKNLMSIAKKLPRKSYLTYGFSKNADLRIIKYKTQADGSTFHLQIKSNRQLPESSKDSGFIPRIHPEGVASLPRMTIKLFGEKNVSNAAGVILTLLQLGFDPKKIKSAVKDFTGAKRRFELIYQNKETYLFDDYGHHPNEIEATISASRTRFPGKRILIIFQPHTFSRTQALLKDFGKSLSLADQSYILPIFASARENPKEFNISSKDIEKISQKNNIKSVVSKKELLQLLTSSLKPNDIIFTMGAGNVYKLSGDIIKIIKSL